MELREVKMSDSEKKMERNRKCRGSGQESGRDGCANGRKRGGGNSDSNSVNLNLAVKAAKTSSS